MSKNRNISSARDQIFGLTQAWAAAIRAKDIEGVMRHYAPDLVVFDVMPPLVTKGADAYRKGWQWFFDSIDGPLSVEMSDVQVVASDDLAFVHCINKVGPASEPAACRSVRVTVGFEKEPGSGRWLVVHEHVSVPMSGPHDE